MPGPHNSPQSFQPTTQSSTSASQVHCSPQIHMPHADCPLFFYRVARPPGPQTPMSGPLSTLTLCHQPGPWSSFLALAFCPLLFAGHDHSTRSQVTHLPPAILLSPLPLSATKYHQIILDPVVLHQQPGPALCHPAPHTNMILVIHDTVGATSFIDLIICKNATLLCWDLENERQWKME